jgi:uncharacterized protein (TIGR03435 family)
MLAISPLVVPFQSFDVASIKPNKAGNNIVFNQSRGDRLTMTGYTLQMLIQSAYDLQDFQIIGGPKWLNSDRFDVIATSSSPDLLKAEQPFGPTRQQLMLRSLLADRFKLVVHNENWELPVFALILVRADGRLGPELRRASVDCAAVASTRSPSTENRPPPARSGDRPGCGSRVIPGAIIAGGITMRDLVRGLSMLSNTGSSLGRMVIDRTGLSRAFDINLHFTPDRIPDFGPGGPVIDPNGPSIFTALQEQLGLKLDAQRGPVDVLVIDRAEVPVEKLAETSKAHTSTRF